MFWEEEISESSLFVDFFYYRYTVYHESGLRAHCQERPTNCSSSFGVFLPHSIPFLICLHSPSSVHIILDVPSCRDLFPLRASQNKVCFVCFVCLSPIFYFRSTILLRLTSAPENTLLRIKPSLAYLESSYLTNLSAARTCLLTVKVSLVKRLPKAAFSLNFSHEKVFRTFTFWWNSANVNCSYLQLINHTR